MDAGSKRGMAVARVDLSRAIGFVNRAGRFMPTNETSEARTREVLTIRGFDIPPTIVFDEIEMDVFRDQARAAGFKVVVIRRGLGR